MSKAARKVTPYPRAPLTALDRRQFLRRAGLAGLGLTLPSVLAACGTSPAGSAGGGATTGGGGGSGTVVWANWPLSIDTDKNGSIPSLAAFTKRTGIKADYSTEINDNDEWFAKIQPLMKSGQGIDASVVSPTDWLAARMIQLGWIDPLPKDKLPHSSNLLPAFAKPPFDPERKYSLPWQGWLAGIAVNTQVTGREVHTIEDLLTAPDLKGKVGLLSEMRETVGLIMLSQGADPANFTDDQFKKALEAIQKARSSGHMRRVTGNDYAPDLAKGNLGACFGWAGDVVQLGNENPKIKFIIPDSGATLGEDTMMIPKGAPNAEGAAKLIDYYFEPEVAAQVAAYVNAFCPVKGAQEAMQKVDPKLADNPLIFPDEQMMKRMHSFKPLSAQDAQRYQGMFDKAIGL